MDITLEDIISINEGVFITVRGETYKSKISRRDGIIGIEDDDKILSPSAFCKKFTKTSCNGWARVFVKRDGKRYTLKQLRDNYKLRSDLPVKNALS